MSILNPLKGKITLEYDTHGNLVKKTDPYNNTVETILNPKKSQKKLRYLNKEITITNDIKTQTKTIKDNNRYPVVIYYDKNGVETKIVYPNGLEESYRIR